MRFISIPLCFLLALLPIGLTAQGESNGGIPADQQFLPSILEANPDASIFYNALNTTRLRDSLEQYIDPSYPAPGYDSTYACLATTGNVAVHYATAYENYDNGQYQRVIWPEKRYFKYTVFVVSDSVLDCVYGVTDAERENVVGKYTGVPGMSLKSYAKMIYDDPAHLNDNDAMVTSPLYKLMSYHILPCWLEYNLLNYRDSYVVNDYLDACPDLVDMEDFYETMLPHAIMRISTPYDKGSGNNGKNIYINRKGTVSAGNLESEGIRIWNPSETPVLQRYALNGGYYYVDSLLKFDQHTKNVLNTRIRVMFSTLSPDFINSGARGRMRQSMGDRPTTFAVYSFKNGFCRNVSFAPGTLLGVRYMDRYWDIVNHDEVTVRGTYDISFKIPAVPESGFYEVRIGTNVPSSEYDRRNYGKILFYSRNQNDEFIPCASPVDMTIWPEDSRIGYVRDDDMSEQEIQANDKLMHSHGYMKYPDSYATNGSILRSHPGCFRKIACEMYMEAGQDYYLRLKQLDNPTYIQLNFMEIVPYSIYSGENGPEDRH